MSNTPLTDSINALTQYANSVSGQSDQNLSDAVYTLAQGYGQGGSSTDVVITESLSNCLDLTKLILADFQADSTKVYMITLKSAHNTTLNNLVYGIIAGKSSNTSFFGTALRYRNGELSQAAITHNYDATVTVGDIYEVTEITPPTTIS